MATTLLTVQGLKVAYGGIQAVKGIDFEVRQGELVSLIGANGAGKTTTLKALTGLQPMAGGSIEFMGQQLVGRATENVVRAGIAHACWTDRQVVQAHAYAEKLRRDYGYDQIEPLDRDGILAVHPVTAAFVQLDVMDVAFRIGGADLRAALDQLQGQLSPHSAAGTGYDYYFSLNLHL